MSDNHYDVIIIGSGAGGGTLAYHLASSGKRILILERGDYVAREIENWSTRAVNVDARYHTKEVWRDRKGKPLHPHTNYYVGGNTKFYGAALFRLRREDLDRKSTRLNSSHANISYAVFCLKKKKNKYHSINPNAISVLIDCLDKKSDSLTDVVTYVTRFNV